MALTHTAKDVYEFKNTGIILMKLPTRMFANWALIFTSGKKEIIKFTDLHYMKYTNDGLTIVASTIESITVYNIQFDDHNLIHSTLDLFDWILSIVCPNTSPRHHDASSSQS